MKEPEIDLDQAQKHSQALEREFKRAELREAILEALVRGEDPGPLREEYRKLTAS